MKKLVHKNATIVPEKERSCPICGELMHVKMIKGVSGDVCEEHGIWLDKGEFTKITRKIKSKMTLRNSNAVKKAKMDGKVSGNLLGLLSFLFD